jgi:ubiquinone/menaquinone biosynthesis C-methylase UbiE
MSSTESAYRIPEKMYRKFPEQSRQLLNSIVQFIEPKKGETIVDVGTGAGFLGAELAEKVGKSGKVIGFDISRSAIRQAKRIIARKDQRRVLEFRVGDVYSLPLEDDFADVVCCKSLIATIDNRQIAVREMARVAKHGGRVVAAEPGELTGLPSRIKRAYFKAIRPLRPLNEHNLRDSFQKAGLSSIATATTEPPSLTDTSMFEWIAENLFGESSLWKLLIEGGAEEDKVRLVHEKMVRQIRTVGLRFGTGAIFCKGTKP